MIERIKLIAPKQFREKYQHQRRPVIFAGGAAHWLAVDRWSPTFFEKRYGTCQVEVAVTPEQRVINEQGCRVSRCTMQLSDYIANCLSPREDRAEYAYLSKSRLLEEAPELYADFEFPSYFSPRESQGVHFWLSPEGAVTPLHFDLPDNLLAQVYGRKQVILYPPCARHYFYPYPWYTAARHVSRLDPSQLDIQQFPLFSKLAGLQVLLNPGDILYIPTGWWHYVTSLDTAISLNLWWQPWFRKYMPDILFPELLHLLAIRVRKWVKLVSTNY